jgi:hypothetical protein
MGADCAAAGMEALKTRQKASAAPRDMGNTYGCSIPIILQNARFFNLFAAFWLDADAAWDEQTNVLL